MKKFNIRNDTMIKNDLQRVFIYPIHPRDSKIFSGEGFIIFDDGQMGRTYRTSSIVKDNTYYFGSIGQPDKFLLNQLLKPKKYHNFKIQDINSKLCGSYCL